MNTTNTETGATTQPAIGLGADGLEMARERLRPFVADGRHWLIVCDLAASKVITEAGKRYYDDRDYELVTVFGPGQTLEDFSREREMQDAGKNGNAVTQVAQVLAPQGIDALPVKNGTGNAVTPGDLPADARPTWKQSVDPRTADGLDLPF